MSFLTQTQNRHLENARGWNVGQMIATFRQRRALSRLDDAALYDIGISRQDAEKEAKRAFWDL
ncbi:MAG: DUF1127 domain-containing protein [Pseudomonadota bacterium]